MSASALRLAAGATILAYLFLLQHLPPDRHIGCYLFLLKALPIWMLAASTFPGHVADDATYSIATDATYRARTTLGLLLSSVGDVFLDFSSGASSPFFMYGLLAFLAAHVAYTKAFAVDLPAPSRLFAEQPALCLALVAYGGAMLLYLHPHLGPVLRVAVPVYAGAIACMGIAATARALRPGKGVRRERRRAARAGAVGALLFIISDSLLSLSRLVHPAEPYPQLLIMVTYFGGQVGIALSVPRPGA